MRPAVHIGETVPESSLNDQGHHDPLAERAVGSVGGHRQWSRVRRPGGNVLPGRRDGPGLGRQAPRDERAASAEMLLSSAPRPPASVPWEDLWPPMPARRGPPAGPGNRARRLAGTGPSSIPRLAAGPATSLTAAADVKGIPRALVHPRVRVPSLPRRCGRIPGPRRGGCTGGRRCKGLATLFPGQPARIRIRAPIGEWTRSARDDTTDRSPTRLDRPNVSCCGGMG